MCLIIAVVFWGLTVNELLNFTSFVNLLIYIVIALFFTLMLVRNIVLARCERSNKCSKPLEKESK